MSALKDLLIEEMQDLLHAETQLTKALPKLSSAAHDPKLKHAFDEHLKQTEGHVERLKQAFELLGEKAHAKPCKAMEGLVAEGSERIKEGKDKDEATSDLSLIGAAQKVEHYEIAGYGTLRALADQLGQTAVSKLFSQTLSEEEKADSLLTQVAQPLVKQFSSEGSETHMKASR
jgi:Mn-containing catalase